MLVMNLLIIVFALAIAKGRVFEIYTQDHLHDILQDTPIGNRPGIVIAFYNDTRECQDNLRTISFDDHNLPSMAHLILAKYEMSTSRQRVWHDYESHLDLAANLGVNEYISNLVAAGKPVECPILVYLPVAYSNYVGDWYRNQPPVNDTSLNLIKFYDSNEQLKYQNKWKTWLWSQLSTSIHIVSIEPYDFEVTIIPNAGRIAEVGNTCDNNGKGSDSCETMDKSIKIATYESSIRIDNIYVGDEIFVSQNPIYPHREAEIASRPPGMASDKYESVKPTSDAPNPTYDVFGHDNWYNNFNHENRYTMKRLDDGRYGFEITMKRFEDIQNDISLIKRRHSTTCMTHTRNLVIPKVLPHKNNPGFKKRKMPAGLHDRLLRFFRHWYFKREIEGWDNTGTQLNFIDVKSYMVSLDHNFKERNSIAEDVVKPILSEWSGGQELEFTAFYGIREYQRDAVLRNHVDRVDTHVFSAILNVGQTNLDEDWDLEVVGFDGKYYQIKLAPGEMALYEGHALIHGRPKPFNGTLFTNAFVHFKPKDWTWSTGQIWRTPVGKETLNMLHVRLQDLYR